MFKAAVNKYKPINAQLRQNTEFKRCKVDEFEFFEEPEATQVRIFAFGPILIPLTFAPTKMAK